MVWAISYSGTAKPSFDRNICLVSCGTYFIRTYFGCRSWVSIIMICRRTHN